MVIAALLLLWHQGLGSLDSTAQPSSGARRDTTERALTDLRTPVIAASREAAGERAVPTEVNPRRALAILQGSEEGPGTGIILGGIFDSTGVRISKGRVLVFADRSSSDPIESLELKDAPWEYQVELAAGEDYWLQADPSSLDGSLTPTLGHAYVSLKRDAVVRLDLTVGRPATVVGRLLAMDGSGIPGATARLIGQDHTQLGFSQDGVTDAGGTFSISEVFPGNYRLRFFHDSPWLAPHPVEVEVEGNRPNDVGDICVENGHKSIRGSVVNQDGWPFPGLEVLCYSNQAVKDGVPSHDMGSVLGSARTDENGLFVLDELPAIQVKISLTPNFNPNSILGPGGPAIWEPSLEFDLDTSSTALEIGAHVVEESRPFEISGQVAFDPDWLAQNENQESDLSATVSLAKGQAMPAGVRRVSLRGKPVNFDSETGAFRCLVETPRPELELRFHLRGQKDLVFTVQPEALQGWSQEIRVPGDFH
ncbi:MAG: hypothetical protein ACI8QS_001336 [Planctomycetota bacterium]